MARASWERYAPVGWAGRLRSTCATPPNAFSSSSARMPSASARVRPSVFVRRDRNSLAGGPGRGLRLPSERGQLTCSGLTAVIVFLRKSALVALLLALTCGGATSLRAAESSIAIDARTGFILEKLQPDKKSQGGRVKK